MKHTVNTAIAVASVVACAWTASADQVGRTSAIIPAASQQAQGTRSDLNLRDPIIRNAELATAERGALEVTFLDGSKLTMGQNSRLTVDEYVYSGQGGANKQTVRYTKGLFRFISGTIPKENVKLETPTVTIGIRGTVLRTAIGDNGAGGVSVEYGPNGEAYEVVVTSKKTGKTVVLKSGQKVEFDGDGVFEGIIDGEIEGCQ
ncbi:MAG: FecR domain-containing protein [Alphaproteobacteria bacterium]|nr:FecR domain-containing protein [Alphaproteobacteria bacterium]